MDHSYTHRATKRSNAAFPESEASMMMDGGEAWLASPLKRIRRSKLLETPPLLSPTSTTTTKEWWKNKQPRTRSDACAVCQRVLSTTTIRPTTNTTLVFPNAGIPDSRGMRDTSLLTYFPPNNAIGEQRPILASSLLLSPSSNYPLSSSSSSYPTRNDDDDSNICSFCEKNVCPDCLAPCNQCHSVYCKFCRTVDYDADGFTTDLCWDCHGVKARTSGNGRAEAEDSMQIG